MTVRASNSRAKIDRPLNVREAPWQTEDLTFEDGVFASGVTEAQGVALVSFVAPVQSSLLVVQANVDAVAADLPTVDDGGFTALVDGERNVVGAAEDGPINSATFHAYPIGATGDTDPVAQALDGASGTLDEPAVGRARPPRVGPAVLIRRHPARRRWSR